MPESWPTPARAAPALAQVAPAWCERCRSRRERCRLRAGDAVGGRGMAGMMGCTGTPLPLPLPLRGGTGAGGSGLMARETNAGGGGATGGGVVLTGVRGAGVAIRTGGTGAGDGLAGIVEMETPSPRPLKGPAISAGTSRCFCAGLRTSELEFSRSSTLLSGNTTGSESYSSSTLNKAGAARRNSPKVILTTPRASCGMIFSIAIEMLARLKSASVSVNRACNCGGRFSRIDCSGISRSPEFSAGAGSGDAERATGFGWGGANCGMGTGNGGGAADVTGRGDWGVSAPVSFSSKRRSNSRSNPANLVFTPFGIAHNFSRRLCIRRLVFSQQEARHRRLGNVRRTAGRCPAAGRRTICLSVGLAVHKVTVDYCSARRDAERQLLLSGRLRLERFGLEFRAIALTVSVAEWNGITPQNPDFGR